MDKALDFSALDALISKNDHDSPETSTMSFVVSDGGIGEHPEGKNALKTHSRESQRITEKSNEVYKAYQDAKKRGGILMSSILKGIIAGEDSTRLLLLACEAISSMTGDALFYEQSRTSLITIYGAGLMQTVPLELELDDVCRRLAMLTRPELDMETAENKERIRRAVKVHEERIAVLKTAIGTAKGTHEDAQEVTQEVVPSKGE